MFPVSHCCPLSLLYFFWGTSSNITYKPSLFLFCDLELSLHLLVFFLPYLEAYTASLVVLPPAVPTLLVF